MGKFLDMFIQVDESDGGAKKAAAPASNMTNAAVSSVPVSAPTVTHNISAPVTAAPGPVNTVSSDVMVERLEKFICEHNLPGPDYLELKNHAVTLIDFIKEESAQYKAAFGLLKKQYPELTKERILSSIDKYIAMLNGERTRGIEECDSIFKANDMTPKINEQKSNLEALKQQIDAVKAEYEKKVSSLEDAYATAQANIAAFERQNADIVAKHERDCATFNASVDTVIGILNEDKEKINAISL